MDLGDGPGNLSAGLAASKCEMMLLADHGQRRVPGACSRNSVTQAAALTDTSLKERGSVLGLVTANRRPWLGLLCAVLALAPVAAARTSASPSRSTTKRPSSSSKTAASKSTSRKTGKRSSRVMRASRQKGGWRHSGQQVIATERARQIQQALIREHYLDGQATGQWDNRTKVAMEHYQASNGWQTKKLPDSRALIKLGLGPDRSNLINPDTAFIAQPEAGKGGAPQN